MIEEQSIINSTSGAHKGSETSAVSKEYLPQEHPNNRREVVDNFDCQVCDLQEKCYGMKLDAIFTRYPRAVDVLEENDISCLKRFVGDIEAICLKRGEGIMEIKLILFSYR